MERDFTKENTGRDAADCVGDKNADGDPAEAHSMEYESAMEGVPRGK